MPLHLFNPSSDKLEKFCSIDEQVEMSALGQPAWFGFFPEPLMDMASHEIVDIFIDFLAVWSGHCQLHTVHTVPYGMFAPHSFYQHLESNVVESRQTGHACSILEYCKAASVMAGCPVRFYIAPECSKLAPRNRDAIVLMPESLKKKSMVLCDPPRSSQQTISTVTNHNRAFTPG